MCKQMGGSLYKKIVSSGVDASAFLLFAVALPVPSGYSYGAVGLLLFSLAGLGCLRHSSGWRPSGLALTGIVLAMGLLWGMSFDGWWSWTGSDYWPKYWLAAGCLLVVARLGVSRQSVEWGLAAGSVGALAIAAYQYLVLGLHKAEGFTNAIQYGGIAMYLGLAAWCVALFGARGWQQSLVFWVCGACGMLASLLSETRGAWVVAPLLLACMLWMLYRNGRVRLAVGTVVAVCALVAAVAIPYGDKFGARADQAVVELQQYLKNPQQGAVTSIGQRMEQWRLALRMGEEKPWTGWGTRGVVEGKKAFVAQGLAHPSVMEYGHAHDEILDMWVKRGLVGVVVLLLFYAIPLAVFWPTRRRLERLPQAQRPAALALRLAAALLPIAYFGFGWTQVFFAHNSGNLFYVFALVAFYGALQTTEGHTPRKE